MVADDGESVNYLPQISCKDDEKNHRAYYFVFDIEYEF